MAHETDGAWTRILDAQTTREELESIIDAHARAALVDALDQIDTLNLGQRDRIAALVQLAPIIRARTALALQSAWDDLQRVGGRA